MTKPPTPLCEQLAAGGKVLLKQLWAEQSEYATAHFGRAALERLNDRVTFIKVVTHAGLISTTPAEVADHIRAYVLSGRLPWR